LFPKKKKKKKTKKSPKILKKIVAFAFLGLKNKGKIEQGKRDISYPLQIKI
jgi:hypothetical protein